MRYEVQDSADFQRVAALPWREWSPADSADCAARYTAALRTPFGGYQLRPVQGVALHEIAVNRGGVLPIRVGGGKTKVAFLAPTVLQAQRPLLLIPASLREAYARAFADYRNHWQISGRIQIESYQTLSRVNAAEFLNQYRPDAIICDEAHFLKNKRAACTRRVVRYARTPAGEQCAFVFMSGTLIKRSLSDFAHLALLALRYRAPVPAAGRVVEEWSRAMDLDIPPDSRNAPGVLARWGTPVREGFRRRFTSTPGIVATQEGPLPIALEGTPMVVKHPEEVSAAFRKLRADWTLPDGHELEDGIAVWRAARELALGHFLRWNPRPPDWWMEPRRQWCAMSRQILKDNRRGLDTDLQVRQAVEAGQYPHAAPILAAWKSVEPKFTPHGEDVWLSDHVVVAVAHAMLEAPAGIVWTDSVAFGRRLAQCTGVPYYAQEGLDAAGRSIEDHPPGWGWIIASVGANATGRNLQAWHHNIVASAPPTGATWEQMLARTHRDGQTAEKVTFRAVLACREHVEGFARAVDDSAGVEEWTGQAHKLPHADIESIPTTTANLPRGPEWA